METYTYDRYLELWEDNFTDDPQGEFFYWQYGREKSKLYKKVSKSEFENSLAEFDRLAAKIDTLQGRPDYGSNPTIDDRVDDLLERSFEYELPLFL